MNKKRALIFGAGVLGIIFSTFLVSAQDGFIAGFGKFWDGLIQILDKVLGTLLGSSAIDGMATGEVLFLKVLFAIIIFAIVWSVLDLVPFFSDNSWVTVIISLSVTILSARFLATPGWISTILLPYSTLGIALTSFLPLLVYFYFVEKTLGKHLTLRKIAWILAAVVFVGLFISRADEIAKVVPSGNFNPIWIYLITAGVCLIFFVFDKTIRRAFVDSEMRALGAADRTALIAELRRKLNTANADFAAGIISQKERDKMLKEFKKRLIAVESY